MRITHVAFEGGPATYGGLGTTATEMMVAQNNFVSNGVVQNLQNQFYQGDFWLRSSADPLFPNPAFPQNAQTVPGNPFLP